MLQLVRLTPASSVKPGSPPVRQGKGFQGQALG
jgi:hypothetical protein